MNEKDIITRVTKTGLFKPSTKGKKIYSFVGPSGFGKDRSILRRYRFNQTGLSIKTELNLITGKHCIWKIYKMSSLLNYRNYIKNSKREMGPANKTIHLGPGT